jgi:hypothetical protein
MCQWMEVRRFFNIRLLGALTVEDDAADSCGMPPFLLLFGSVHHQELPERKPPGFHSDDSCELEYQVERIASWACLTI